MALVLNLLSGNCNQNIFHRFMKLSREQLKNLMNSFINNRYMLGTIFISHLTILGLSYTSIRSYQRKWSRDKTWMKILGVIFPVVFIACEKACAKHLLTMAKGKLKREYPSLPRVESVQDLNFRWGSQLFIIYQYWKMFKAIHFLWNFWLGKKVLIWNQSSHWLK